MKDYSTFPSLLFLQHPDSEFCQNQASDPTISLQMCSNMNETVNQDQLHHANSMFSSGLSYLNPSADASGTMNSLVPTMTNQCSSSNADNERNFVLPFQSDMLRDSRKRPLDDIMSGDGIFSMIRNTTFPDQLKTSKRKTIQQSVDAHVFKVPPRKSQKLSDKIASLQKIVSPYGKTDTASVLQEACMYIRIAHQEIRRLKISYFGARQLQSQLMHPDLRSKGLCIAPVSMASKLVTEDSDHVSNNNDQGVSDMINAWRF